MGKFIIAGGNDSQVTCYNPQGQITQRFDYGQNKDLRDFLCAALSPAGETIALSNYSSILVLGFNSKRQEWEEKEWYHIKDYGQITAMSWSPDGSKLLIGGSCGSIDALEVSLKKLQLKGNVELNYLSPSQIKVLMSDLSKEVLVKSNRELEILKVSVNKHFITAFTNQTIIISNGKTGLQSEVDWNGSGQEQFFFDSEQICWIHNAGEVTVVEFGSNELAGTFRSEYIKRRLVSAVVKTGKNAKSPRKYIAYLLDR